MVTGMSGMRMMLHGPASAAFTAKTVEASHAERMTGRANRAIMPDRSSR